MSRMLKLALSMMVFVATGFWEFLLRVAGRRTKGRCVILYYHSIPASQRSLFSRQLDLLLRHAKPLSLGESVELNAGGHYVAVTFDDGFENFVGEALPELVKRKVPAAMFVIVGALDKSFGRADHSERVMSLEHLRALPEDLVTVGSHTVTHPMLPQLTEEEARNEIRSSRAKLEEILGRKVVLFSFPFGGFNQRLVELCAEAGYERVFTTLPEFSRLNSNSYVAGRVRVDPTDWPIEFHLKLAGAYRWMPLAFRLKRNLISLGFISKMFGRNAGSRKTVTPESIIRQ